MKYRRYVRLVVIKYIIIPWTLRGSTITVVGAHADSSSVHKRNASIDSEWSLTSPRRGVCTVMATTAVIRPSLDRIKNRFAWKLLFPVEK